MFKKMEKESFYYGFPVVLMTTKDEMTGNDNLTPISSTWTLGKTIVIGISMHSKEYTNLKVGHAVTFNLADQTLWEKIEKIAKTTGHPIMPDYKQKAGYSFCSDKFQLGKFTKLAGEEVTTVRIKECPIQIETLVQRISTREDFAIVECEIVAIFVEEGILHDPTHINVDKWQPLIYKFREYTTANQSLSWNFRFQEFKES